MLIHNSQLITLDLYPKLVLVGLGDNPNVAIVNIDGEVTAVARGTTTVPATTIIGGEIEATCGVTVMIAEFVITYLVDEKVFI